MQAEPAQRVHLSLSSLLSEQLPLISSPLRECNPQYTDQKRIAQRLRKCAKSLTTSTFAWCSPGTQSSLRFAPAKPPTLARIAHSCCSILWKALQSHHDRPNLRCCQKPHAFSSSANLAARSTAEAGPRLCRALGQLYSFTVATCCKAEGQALSDWRYQRPLPELRWGLSQCCLFLPKPGRVQGPLRSRHQCRNWQKTARHDLLHVPYKNIVAISILHDEILSCAIVLRGLHLLSRSHARIPQFDANDTIATSSFPEALKSSARGCET